MSLAASPLRNGDDVGHPTDTAQRPVTVTAPPLFGAAVRSHLDERDPPEPPPVDRGPLWWPLPLAVMAVMVAPTGAVALVP